MALPCLPASHGINISTLSPTRWLPPGWQSGTLDQDELAALVVGTMGFLKDKFKAEQKTAKVELDKQLKEAKKDPLMGGTRDTSPRLNVPLLYTSL
eukprot:COSAG01_NODE_212_length_21797_cov_14.197806_19_plen_96_part_00